jgi:hypothetical protein
VVEVPLQGGDGEERGREGGMILLGVEVMVCRSRSWRLFLRVVSGVQKVEVRGV